MVSEETSPLWTGYRQSPCETTIVNSCNVGCAIQSTAKLGMLGWTWSKGQSTFRRGPKDGTGFHSVFLIWKGVLVAIPTISDENR